MKISFGELRPFRLLWLAMLCALLALMVSCGRLNTSWKEEVRLSSGQLITIERTARGAITRDIAMRGTGWKPREPTLRIPRGGQDSMPPPVWRSVLIPVVLDYDPASDRFKAISKSWETHC